MGDSRASEKVEIATIQCAVEQGAGLIDTAEMYGDGQAEELVGKALEGRRDQAFIVSKVLPQNATRKGTLNACRRSLQRLRTDRIDLYLLHWRGEVPFLETMKAFLELKQAGQIRHYGVSNLDLDDMKELWSVDGSSGVETDQLLYNLSRRNIEWDLLPWLRARHIPVMAYSPIEQSRLLKNPKLVDFARRHVMSPAQVALAWLLAKDDVIVIPKTAQPERLKENLGALDHPLDSDQLAELDRLFPAPSGRQPLEML
jgi:aldehyde reductase